MNMKKVSFYKVLTVVYEQEGLDANNTDTIETINKYKCYHINRGLLPGNTDQGKSGWHLRLMNEQDFDRRNWGKGIE